MVNNSSAKVLLFNDLCNSKKYVIQHKITQKSQKNTKKCRKIAAPIITHCT